jgi:hypothetical protein
MSGLRAALAGLWGRLAAELAWQLAQLIRPLYVPQLAPLAPIPAYPRPELAAAAPELVRPRISRERAMLKRRVVGAYFEADAPARAALAAAGWPLYA